MPTTTPIWAAIALFLGSLVPGWDLPLRAERMELRAGHAIANNSNDQPSGFQLSYALPSVAVPLTQPFGPSWARGRILWQPELQVGLFSEPYARPLWGLHPFQFQYELGPWRSWSLYAVSGVGGIYANIERQETGSDGNLSLIIGGGLRYAATPRAPRPSGDGRGTSWLLEYRHLHISNAGSDDQNSGIDAHTVLLGLAVPF